jgi:phosphatidylinositol alpha-1,6-mannosyltransferase
MAKPSSGQSMTPRIKNYLVISQVFPPAVGGSGVLLDNVYSRVGDGHVIVLADIPEVTNGSSNAGTMEVRSTRIKKSWGLFDPHGWPNQMHLARAIYQLASRGRAIVHCGRAQPEAVPAWIASLMPGGPRYVFWAHGEDIAVSMSSRQYAATMRLVYGGASAAIANSQNTARMIQAVGWYRGPVHVVYPGVDAQRFHPGADDGSLRRRLAPNGELLLLSVSRLQKRKGHDLVLKALPALLREFPQLRYVIAGAGDEQDALQRLVVELQLQGSVQFDGEVSEAELPGYFAACDIFVLPTRVEPTDFEGFGIVYLEAAAAGKPAIGGRNGGVPEAVADGTTGLLVSGTEVSELVEAIRTLCASEPLRRQFGEDGRLRAVRDFTWERAAAQVTKIHTDLACR